MSAPQQVRARATFERVLAAGVRLLEEKGRPGVTMNAVLTLAATSTGAIYGRVRNKKALMQAIEQRVGDRLKQEHLTMLLRIRQRQPSIESLLPVMIGEMADYTRRNAVALNALLDRGVAGRQPRLVVTLAYARALSSLRRLLVESRGGNDQCIAKREARICIDVICSSLARHFGIGRLAGKAGPRRLGVLVEDLNELCLVFLAPEYREFCRFSRREIPCIDSGIEWWGKSIALQF